MNILPTTHTKTYKRKALLGLLLFFCVHLFLAQNKLLKLDKEFAFSEAPLFKLNASHNQIILTPWDKKTIKITAYSTANADAEFLKNTNDLWEINIQSSDSILILNTDGSKQLPKQVISNYSSNTSNPKNVLLQSVLDPLIKDFKNSSIPEVLQQKINESKFNFDAYKSLGDTYFKIWEYNLVKDLDEKSAQEVRDWYNQMSSKLINASSSSTNVSNTPNGTNKAYAFYESHTVIPNVLVNKIVEIMIPKKSISFFNTRFGSLKIKDKIENLQAKLKYTSFNANQIDGEETNVSIASAPVEIKKWNNGSLQLRYVKSSEIGYVDNIKLEVTSSKTLIHWLTGSGVFNSTFSQLGIENTNDNFKNLSFLSTNSDLVLKLPKNGFNFIYSGEMSGIKIPPNTLELKSLGDYRKLVLHGYAQSRYTDREIEMNMVNSQIILK